MRVDERDGATHIRSSSLLPLSDSILSDTSADSSEQHFILFCKLTSYSIFRHSSAWLLAFCIRYPPPKKKPFLEKCGKVLGFCTLKRGRFFR